jgi:hypothetical protein
VHSPNLDTDVLDLDIRDGPPAPEARGSTELAGSQLGRERRPPFKRTMRAAATPLVRMLGGFVGIGVVRGGVSCPLPCS